MSEPYSSQSSSSSPPRWNAPSPKAPGNATLTPTDEKQNLILARSRVGEATAAILQIPTIESSTVTKALEDSIDSLQKCRACINDDLKAMDRVESLPPSLPLQKASESLSLKRPPQEPEFQPPKFKFARETSADLEDGFVAHQKAVAALGNKWVASDPKLRKDFRAIKKKREA